MQKIMESWTVLNRNLLSSAQFPAAVYKPSNVCEFWKIVAPSLQLWASVAGIVGGSELSSYRCALAHGNHHKEVREKSNPHEQFGMMLSQYPQSSWT